MSFSMDQKTQVRIRRILDAAYNEVPYFNQVINELIEDTREITPELIGKMPIFSKRDIWDIGWLNFVSGEYLDEEFEVKQDSNSRLERTSGTSGNPMRILWNNDDYFSSTINHWKFRRKKYGITPPSKMCTTAKTLPRKRLFSVDENGHTLTLSTRKLNLDTIGRLIDEMNEYKPEWLYIQNSVLFVFVYFAKLLGKTFPDSIRYIEYIGEPLCEYYRKCISEVIPVPYANMYGCVETNGISYSCDCGKNHLLPENVLVEIVEENGKTLEDGKVGYVCVTGLHNTAMPMIRYRLNDLAVIHSDSNCKCGNANPTIEILAARMPSYMILNDPNVFAEAELLCPVNSGVEVFDTKPDDIVFNLKVNTLDHYEILIPETGTDIPSDLEDTLHRIFNAYEMPNVKFTIQKAKQFDLSIPIGLFRRR